MSLPLPNVPLYVGTCCKCFKPGNVTAHMICLKCAKYHCNYCGKRYRGARCDECYKAHSRRAAKSKNVEKRKLRVPAWADLEKIAAVYAERKELQATLGGDWIVDHIIPLNGEFVSGLHVHNNLRVVLNKRNVEKRERFIPYSVKGLDTTNGILHPGSAGREYHKNLSLSIGN